MVFADFIGQERWQMYFSRLVQERRLGHAYLFIGPAHVGKRTFVWQLTRAVLCRSSGAADAGPCGRCSSCQSWRADLHPDLTTLSADVAAAPGVAEVRRFNLAVAIAPAVASVRVAVVEEVDRLTPEGWHALLKVIEEPPPGVVFSLTAAAPLRLPATVRSRLQQCALSPVTRPVLAAALRHRGATRSAADELAALAAGRPGLALSWLADPASRQAYEARARQLLDLMTAPLAARFAFTESLAQDQAVSTRDLAQLLSDWSLVLRDAIVRLAGEPGLAAHGHLREQLDQAAAGQTLAAPVRRYRALEAAERALVRNAQRRLVVNTFLLNA